MRKIGIFNNKGGVAKTTSVINIAYSMHKAGYKVMVLDCDTQENCFSLFVTGMVTANILSIDFENISHTTWEMFGRVNAEKLEEFDYILFDLPPTFGDKVDLVLSQCDDVYVPIVLGEFEIAGLKKVTDCIQTIGGHLGGIFITMYDKETDEELLPVLQRAFQNNLLQTVIPFSKSVRKSQKAGMPIEPYFDQNKTPNTKTARKIAICYENLAAEIVGENTSNDRG